VDNLPRVTGGLSDDETWDEREHAAHSDDAELSRPFKLSDEQIQQIASRLREGKPLPPYLLPHLFERPREYELAYAGKMRRVDVIAETMALPLQREKTFGDGAASWANMLILGDNLQVLRTLLAQKERGALKNADGTDGVRLCYIDPPFATRREFSNKRGEQVFEDRVAGAEFVEFLRRRLILIRELLAVDGALYLHLDTNKVHYMKVILDEIFGPQNFQGEIIWKRSSAHSDSGQGSQHFGRIHDSILFYSRTDAYLWDPQHVPHDDSYIASKYSSIEVGSGRRYQMTDITGPGGAAKGNPRYEVMGVMKYWRYSRESMEKLIAEGRIIQSKPGAVPRYKRYLDEQEGLPLQDVWTDISPVNSMARDRQGYPTQKPLALVERILRASSREGDLVLDCFAGSGTTAVAAESMGRRWVAVDCAKFATYTTQSRLLRLAGEGAVPTFTTYNAGLYDFQSLKSLDWNDYRAFALRLFQCRDEPINVGGFQFDGIFQDDPVHVFNVRTHGPGVSVGAEYVEDLVAVCGSGLGRRCFIVAPALSVDLYEDYIDVSGTRFYFLRIPYSVIAELHKRAFSELRQPTSQQVANATIDSIGFDFIQTPDVLCRYDCTDDGQQLRVTIERFHSEAYAADETEEAVADLAMVMVDYSYEGDVFDVDGVHYGEDLRRSGWSFLMPASAVEGQLMLVYLDVFGNELRETKQLEDFGSKISSETKQKKKR